MSTPTTDRGALQQVIRALKAAGWVPSKVDNGEDVIKTPNETSMLAEIFAVDMCHAFFRRESEGPGGALGYLFVVLGNDPEEVIADYTLNLDPTVDQVQQGWWS